MLPADSTNLGRYLLPVYTCNPTIFPVAAPQHANQDEWKASTTAQGLYDKILSKIEAEVVSLGAIFFMGLMCRLRNLQAHVAYVQEDERAPTGFSREAVHELAEEPNQREDKAIKQVVIELMTTSFFDSLPEEIKDMAFWMKVLRLAVLQRDLCANSVLYDASKCSEASDPRSPEILVSPTRKAPSFLSRAKRTASALHILKHDSPSDSIGLFIVLSGAVQVVKNVNDQGTLLSTGDVFGHLAPEELANPISAQVFCDKTDVLEIKPDMLKRAHDMQNLDYKRFLMSTRLFANLSEAQVAQLVPLLHIKKYRSNEIIVRQGEPATDLFILARGTVRVLQEVVVPYQMMSHGYVRTPSDAMEPVSASAVTTLAHVRQGRFSVKSKTQATVQSARTMMGSKKPAMARIQQDSALQEATKEILSARGTFVSTMSRLVARNHMARPRNGVEGGNADVKRSIHKPNLSALHALNSSGHYG